MKRALREKSKCSVTTFAQSLNPTNRTTTRDTTMTISQNMRRSLEKGGGLTMCIILNGHALTAHERAECTKYHRAYHRRLVASMNLEERIMHALTRCGEAGALQSIRDIPYRLEHYAACCDGEDAPGYRPFARLGSAVRFELRHRYTGAWAHYPTPLCGSRVAIAHAFIRVYARLHLEVGTVPALSWPDWIRALAVPTT